MSVENVARSATSTMLEKVSDEDEYCAGLQAYTIRHLDKPVPTGNDIEDGECQGVSPKEQSETSRMIDKHFRNVMLVGLASEISKNYTYKCVDHSRHNGIKGAKAKCTH